MGGIFTHVRARLDTVAEDFWGRYRQNAFFDVRVFNPYSPSHHGTTLAQCYRRNEQEKKRAYEERVREIEHGSFSPLVFSTREGWAQLPQWSTNRLLAKLLRNVTNHNMTELSSGFGANIVFHCYSLPSCASEDQGPHPACALSEAIDFTCSESRFAPRHYIRNYSCLPFFFYFRMYHIPYYTCLESLQNFCSDPQCFPPTHN